MMKKHIANCLYICSYLKFCLPPHISGFCYCNPLLCIKHAGPLAMYFQTKYENFVFLQRFKNA